MDAVSKTAIITVLQGTGVMDFYAVLNKVIELLQRHKRVTYRALKLQFELDDETLDTLKAELLLARHDQCEEYLTGFHRAVVSYRERLTLYLEWFLALLAQVYGQCGQPDTGLVLLAEAFEMVNNKGKQEESCWTSDLYRLKGVLLLSQSAEHQATAETCFQQALDVARSQQAKSWELRAATSLARLWQSQGKRQEAHDLHAPVYNWFTEGFDMADLKDARALLAELT